MKQTATTDNRVYEVMLIADTVYIIIYITVTVSHTQRVVIYIGTTHGCYYT